MTYSDRRNRSAASSDRQRLEAPTHWRLRRQPAVRRATGHREKETTAASEPTRARVRPRCARFRAMDPLPPDSGRSADPPAGQAARAGARERSTTCAHQAQWQVSRRRYSGRITQIDDLQSRETTNAIQSPAGDHIGTPTLTSGSTSCERGDGARCRRRSSRCPSGCF